MRQPALSRVVPNEVTSRRPGVASTLGGGATSPPGQRDGLQMPAPAGHPSTPTVVTTTTRSGGTLGEQTPPSQAPVAHW